MIRTVEEITKALADLLGERMTEDAAISLTEDIADTINAPAAVTADTRDYDELERRYNELDRSWRERYTKRFYDSGDDTADIITEDKRETEKEPDEITIDDLFEEKERKD